MKFSKKDSPKCAVDERYIATVAKVMTIFIGSILWGIGLRLRRPKLAAQFSPQDDCSLTEEHKELTDRPWYIDLTQVIELDGNVELRGQNRTMEKSFTYK